MSRIAVAMSGGVDSSMAAALLLEEGHEVAGITLRLLPGASGCCAAGGARRAARVAAALGIPHYVWDVSELFEREVIGPFCRGYLEGRTPNPCLACNGKIKFEAMLDRALGLGFDALATGHYARLASGADAGGRLRSASGGGQAPRTGAGAPALMRARDAAKDQSYALYMIRREVLGSVRFPLGELTKEEVRARASALRLASASTPESQDICFVEGGRVADYVLSRAVRHPAGGAIVDRSGAVLGTHDGVHRFTLGQRRGTRVAAGSRRYVTDIDPRTARVVVGPSEDLLTDVVRFEAPNVLVDDAEGPVDAMTRYRGPVTAGTLHLAGRGATQPAEVHLAEPAIRPSPGQAIVCYRGDVVVAGGVAC